MYFISPGTYLANMLKIAKFPINGICCFIAKRSALRSKRKDQLVEIRVKRQLYPQIVVSVSQHCKNPTHCVCLIQSRHHCYNHLVKMYKLVLAICMIIGVVVWCLDLQLPMQSVPITAKFMSLNPTHGEVFSIQHYMIKFVSDFLQIGGFLLILRFPPSIKLTVTI